MANGSLRLRPRFHYEGLTLAINNLLPFAGGVGANVEDQAAYAADIERVAGNQPGIARSALVNKALLQSTKVSTAVGSFMAAFQPSDVSDSTTDADFLAQLKQAVITGSVPVAVASGTPDAISAVYPVPPAALVQGVPFYVLAAAANITTTPTFTPNVGVIPEKLIVKGANIPLAPGDISGAGMWLCLQYNEASDVWVLANPASSITSSGIVKFTNSGSFTVPRGVSKIYVSCCGGGGGGGAGGSSNNSLVAGGGAGGGAANFALKAQILVTPGQVIPVTIGTGGLAGVSSNFGLPGGNGGTGGNTIIGSSINVEGGGGGGGGLVGAGVAFGGSINGFSNAQNGLRAVLGQVGTGSGGSGGSGPFGGAGQGAEANGAVGSQSIGYGAGSAGGSGSYSAENINSGAGREGQPGLTIIEW